MGQDGDQAMLLRIRGGNFTTHVYQEISAITDRALLSVRQVKYTQTDGVITMPIKRFGLERRGRLLGPLTPYKRDKSKEIRSAIILRNVACCTIEKEFLPEDLDEVTLLFGVGVKRDTVFLCSAEECGGKPCYSLGATVRVLDIEIRDDDEPLSVSREPIAIAQLQSTDAP